MAPAILYAKNPDYENIYAIRSFREKSFIIRQQAAWPFLTIKKWRRKHQLTAQHIRRCSMEIISVYPSSVSMDRSGPSGRSLGEYRYIFS
jgi:hypothetical protein